MLYSHYLRNLKNWVRTMVKFPLDFAYIPEVDTLEITFIIESKRFAFSVIGFSAQKTHYQNSHDFAVAIFDDIVSLISNHYYTDYGLAFLK